MATKRKSKNPKGQGCTYSRGPSNWWIKYPPAMVTADPKLFAPHGGYPDKATADRVRIHNVTQFALRGTEGTFLGSHAQDAAQAARSAVPTLGELAQRWLDSRDATHRSNRQDRNRWRKHIGPYFDAKRPREVDHAFLQSFIVTKRTEGYNPNYCGHMLRQISSLFSDLVLQKIVPPNDNPFGRGVLPKSIRELIRPTWNVEQTPFVHTPELVKRLLAILPEYVAECYGVGAYAGLRTSEQLACTWDDTGNRVDLERGTITVRCQIGPEGFQPTKTKKTRVVPIANDLRPLLAAHRLRTGGVGLLFPPTGVDGNEPDEEGGGRFMRRQTLHKWLAAAMAEINAAEPGALDKKLDWYKATRHTFASLYVIGGGNINFLKGYMGHSSITISQRYAHLVPGNAADLDRLGGDSDPVKPAVTASKPPAARRAGVTALRPPQRLARHGFDHRQKRPSVVESEHAAPQLRVV